MTPPVEVETHAGEQGKALNHLNIEKDSTVVDRPVSDKIGYRLARDEL